MAEAGQARAMVSAFEAAQATTVQPILVVAQPQFVGANGAVELVRLECAVYRPT